MSKTDLTRTRGLYAITWMADTAALLIMFTVGRFLAEQGADLLTLGLLGAVMAIVQAAAAIVSGRMSDRVGRRGFVLIGAAAMLAASGLVLAARTRPAVTFISYALLGGGLGVYYPSLIAWLNHGTDRQASPNSISGVLLGFCLAFNLGIFAGQAGGGLLYPLGYHWPLLLAVLLLSGICAILFVVPQPAAAQIPTEVGGAGGDDGTRPKARRFAGLSWVANLGSAFTISMVLHLFPRLAVDMGIPSQHHGLILAGMRGVIILTYLFLHRFRFWHYRISTSLAAQGLGIFALILVVISQEVGGVITGLLVLGILIGHNYFASLYYSTTRGGDEERGRAAGMHEGTLGLGIALGSAGGGVAGILAGNRIPYLVAACVILVVAGLQIVMWRRSNR